MFEGVDGQTHGQMHAQTPARVPYYKLTLSLRLWWAKKKICMCCLEYLDEALEGGGVQVSNSSLIILKNIPYP